MSQHSIPNLATPAGRSAFQQYWHELVVDQHRSVVPTLLRLWRTAAFAKELTLSEDDSVYKIGHPLGPRAGTRVFMEEVIVRHYFNNVQALVYFGAVVLLVFLGLRFAGILTETVSLIGVAVESLMLLLLFAVLFYSPEDSYETSDDITARNAPSNDTSEETQTIREVLGELEEIGSSYAGLGLKLEQLVRAQEEGLRELAKRVGTIQGLNHLETHSQTLETTNHLLANLTATIAEMNGRIDMFFGKELEYYVRQEIQRMVGRDFNGSPNNGEGGKEKFSRESL